MVKLEGGAWLAPTVAFLRHAAIPGLRPRRPAAAVGPRAGRLSRPGQDAGRRSGCWSRMRARSTAAGAAMLVVECVPSAVGAALTRAAGVPVIGIGAGAACSGQVLVIYDALGIQPGRPARFVRNFMPGTTASRRRSPLTSPRSRTARFRRPSIASERIAHARDAAGFARNPTGPHGNRHDRRRASRRARRRRTASRSCRRWATCTPAICRCAGSRASTATRSSRASSSTGCSSGRTRISTAIRARSRPIARDSSARASTSCSRRRIRRCIPRHRSTACSRRRSPTSSRARRAPDSSMACAPSC